MNPDHSRYAQWDAAYMLGALSPAERGEYEEHLASCDDCRLSIGELSPLPGLLARLSNERAAALLDAGAESTGTGPAGASAASQDATPTDAAATGPRPDLVDAILRKGGRRRGIRGLGDLPRSRLWMALAAAAAILVAAVVVPLTLDRSAPDEQTVALQAIGDLPITASVTLTPVGWGTRMELECRYEGTASADTPKGGWPYALYVVDDDGERTTVSSWRAAPGATARLEAGTSVDLERIASIEIGGLGDGPTLMRGKPSSSD